MSRAIQAAGGVLYRALHLLLGTAVRLYYRRIQVRHGERIPADGPLLIVANHPASLTDVLALAVGIDRRLHFVAYSGLFEPPLLGFVLRLVGTVPVYRKEDAAELMHRNVDMFGACQKLLASGGAVLIFPEGTSQGDRRIEKLKTGAARMALAYECAPGVTRGLVLLPVGLHFEARTTFRSELTLSVGHAIPLELLRALASSDEAQAVRALTDQIRAALEKLTLNVPSDELAKLVHDVQQLYLAELREATPRAPDLTLVRAIADSIEFYRATDPERLHRIWTDVVRYRRQLAALDLRDQAVRDLGSGGGGSVRLVAGALIGLPFGLAGGAVHYVPYRLSGILGGLFASDPTRIAFSRIICGVVLFPLTYAAIAFVLYRMLGWNVESIVLTLTACVPLGLFSMRYYTWLRRERHRLRLALLASANRRIVVRVRRARRRIVRLLDRAREDYLASLAAAERPFPE
jgi:1-acyl-sn-glycerol-3-phosphate acyltransferase